MLVGGDVGHADAHDVIDGRAETDRVRDVAGARLEAERRPCLIHRPLERDVGDHVPAALPGRHRVEHVELAVDDADAGRAEHLVSGEDVEVAVERLDVDGHVRDRLRPVDERARAVAMRIGHHLLDGHDRAERVRDLRNETSFVRGPSSLAYSYRMTCPSSSTGTTRRLAPLPRRQSICHGTMLAWCSSQVTTISSPC